MPQNDQTHFKNLAANAAKLCLTILGYYALIEWLKRLKKAENNDSDKNIQWKVTSKQNAKPKIQGKTLSLSLHVKTLHMLLHL